MLKLFRPVELAAGLVMVALVGGALLASGASVARSKSSAESGSDPGTSLYQTQCAVCHGSNGRGSEIGKNLDVPDLHSSKVQSRSSSYLGHFIRNGKGAMPAFGSRLSSEQITSLVTYLRRLGASDRK